MSPHSLPTENRIWNMLMVLSNYVRMSSKIISAWINVKHLICSLKSNLFYLRYCFHRHLDYNHWFSLGHQIFAHHINSVERWRGSWFSHTVSMTDFMGTQTKGINETDASPPPHRRLCILSFGLFRSQFDLFRSWWRFRPAQQRHQTNLEQVFCFWQFPNQKFPPSFHVAFSLVCIQKTGAQLLKWTPVAPEFVFFFSVTCHVRVGMRRWCSWSWGDFNAWECVQKQELLPWRMLVQRDIDPVPVLITAVEVVLIELQPCLWNIKSKWKGL